MRALILPSHWTAAAIPALVGIALAGASVITHSPAVIRSLLAPSAAHTDSSFASLLALHDETSSRSAARFVGRSMFFAPTKPKEPAVKAESLPVLPDPVPQILSAPAQYTGPEPTGFLGDSVLFAGRRLRVGESLDGVTLLEASSPNHIRVRLALPGHEDGEYLLRIWNFQTRGFELAEPIRR